MRKLTWYFISVYIINKPTQLVKLNIMGVVKSEKTTQNDQKPINEQRLLKE